MINLRQMRRVLDDGLAGGAGAFERVIEQILANGRCHCPAVRQRLLNSSAVQTVALGLALQRSCELTYGRTGQGLQLAEQLAKQQDEDGMFEGDVAATAVAVRAMLDWADLPRADRAGAEQAETTGEGDVQWAMVALAECQDASGVLSGDVVGSAIVLWQLGDRPEVCKAFGEVHWRKLAAAVRRGGGAVSEEFSRFALAMAA